MQTDVCAITNWREYIFPRTARLAASISALLIVTFGGAIAARAQACPSTSASYPCAYAATSTGITVIDIATQTALPTQIAVPGAGTLAVSPDNSYLWAVTSSSASNSTTISPIDTTTGTVLTPVTILEYPNLPEFLTPAITPDGRYIYVPSTGYPYLEVIDTTAATMIATQISSASVGGLTAFQGVGGISIANGNVYVADTCSNGEGTQPCIDTFPVGTNQVTNIIPIAGYPSGTSTAILVGISVVPSNDANLAYVGMTISSGEQVQASLDGISLLDGSIQSSAALDASDFQSEFETPDGSQVFASTVDETYFLSTQSASTATGLGCPSASFAITPDGSSLYAASSPSGEICGGAVLIYSTTTEAELNTLSISTLNLAIMHNLPVPVIGQPLVPKAAPAGTAGLTLTVNGSQFVPSSIVNWNGNALATTYVSPIQLTAVVPASDLSAEAAAAVTVINPGPGGGTSNTSSFSVTGPPPAITVQPASQSITAGQTVTLSVTATGVGTLTYQWFTGLTGITTNPIVGATGSTYTFVATASANYWVQVSVADLSFETTNSNTAAITVVPIPLAISVQPASQSVPSGQTATLSITATGTGTLTYQWFAGLSGDMTNPIVGATSSSFTTPVLTADSSYWVQVSQSGPPTESIESISAIVVVGAVFAGQSETINLELPPNPSWPLNSTVTLSCTNVSLNGGVFVPITNYNLSCDVSPVTLQSSASSQPFTVTVGTSAGTTTAINAHGGEHLTYGAGLLPISGLALLGAGLLFPRSYRKKGVRWFISAIVALGFIGFTSCGGHFTPPVVSGGHTVTPAGKYEVLVVATDTQAPTGFQQTSLVVPLTVSPMSN